MVRFANGKPLDPCVVGFGLEQHALLGVDDAVAYHFNFPERLRAEVCRAGSSGDEHHNLLHST